MENPFDFVNISDILFSESLIETFQALARIISTVYQYCAKWDQPKKNQTKCFFQIFPVSLIWCRLKCHIRNTCNWRWLCMFHLKWFQSCPSPTWFDTVADGSEYKFQFWIVFIWLTKLHISFEITATGSEMVICLILGSKIYTSFERS